VRVHVELTGVGLHIALRHAEACSRLDSLDFGGPNFPASRNLAYI